MVHNFLFYFRHYMTFTYSSATCNSALVFNHNRENYPQPYESLEIHFQCWGTNNKTYLQGNIKTF